MTDREKVESALINADILKYCTVKELTEIACSLIANGVTVNEWRPASEPPKDECPCIILSSKGGKMLIAQYKPEQRSWSYIANQHLISHWMPLPQPPPKGE